MRTIIGGGRNCGKTTELIKISAETGYPIVCVSKAIAHVISSQAHDLGFKIPFPITFRELPLKSSKYKAVLVDEIEHLLEELIGRVVYVGATSAEMKILPGAVKRPIYPWDEEDEDE